MGIVYRTPADPQSAPIPLGDAVRFHSLLCFCALICVLVLAQRANFWRDGGLDPEPQAISSESFGGLLVNDCGWPPLNQPYSTRHLAPSQLVLFGPNEQRLEFSADGMCIQFRGHQDDPKPPISSGRGTGLATPTIHAQQIRLQV